MKYYQKSLPIKEDEYQDLVQLKIELEQILKKPITIRNLVRAIIKYAKEQKESKDFIKKVAEVVGASIEENVLIKDEKPEKKNIIESFRSKLFKK